MFKTPSKVEGNRVCALHCAVRVEPLLLMTFYVDFASKKALRLCSRAYGTNVELFMPILFQSAWMCFLDIYFHVGLPLFLPGKAENWLIYSSNVAVS